MKFKKLLIYTNNLLIINNNDTQHYDYTNYDVIFNNKLKNINDIYYQCERNYHYFLFLTDETIVDYNFVEKILIELDKYSPAIMVLNKKCKIYHRSVLNYVFPYLNYEDKGNSIYMFQDLIEFPLKPYTIINNDIKIEQKYFDKQMFINNKINDKTNDKINDEIYNKIFINDNFIIEKLYTWIKPSIKNILLKGNSFREIQKIMANNFNEYVSIKTDDNKLLNFFEYVNINNYFDITHEYFKNKIAKFYHREIHGDCKLYHFAHDFRIINRNSIINHIIITQNYSTYLEIGTYNCYHFHDVKLIDKYGVEPNPPIDDPIYKLYENRISVMTSVEFFNNIDDNIKFDIIFIDGCLLEKNIINDIEQSLLHINKNGVIIIHDCNPPTEYLQRDKKNDNLDNYGHVIWNNKLYNNKNWQGKTWKAIVKLRMTRDDLDIYVVDTDWGIGIIKYGNNTDKLIMNMEDDIIFQYNTFMKYRKKMLNLIDAEQFFKLYPLVLS